MNRMNHGKISGINKPVSRLIQGTAFFNEGKAADYISLLDAVYDCGCTTFDTGHSYNSGGGERILGRWMEQRGLRDRVVIVSKGGHPMRGVKRVTPGDMTADLYESLDRLRTHYIDVYLFHRDDPAEPVGPLVETMNEHLRAGNIRAYGGSNWTVERIAEANRYAEDRGLVGMGISSPQFSLAEAVKEPWPGCVSISGESGRRARQWYAEQHMPLFTWSSLAGGFMSGRFTPDNLDSFDDQLDKASVQAYCYPQNFARLDRARQLAAEKGLTLPQVGLAYIFSQPLDVYTIIGSRSAAEFAANVDALNVRLSKEEIAWLEGGSV